MGGTDGTRAVSEVMGAILVFGILITALGIYQAVVVPNANEEVEFKHNAEVQQDFVDLRNAVQRSSTSGDDGSVTVDLGVRYPTRALTLNPPEQGGTLQGKTTGPSGPVSLGVDNAEAVDGEVDDYWDGSEQAFATGRVVFSPSYSVYQHAPDTVVENGIVYNRFEEDTDIPLSGQQVVSGTKISLVALDSDLSLSQVETTAVDVNPNSASTTKVAVRNSANDENVTITIPTKLGEEVWVGQLLNDQIDGADGSTTGCDEISNVAASTHGDRYIKDCHYRPGTEFNNLTLVMERDTTYTLNMAKVSVGKSGSSPGAHYVVPVEGDNASISNSQKQKLAVQVRDRFDNPVSNSTVTFELQGVPSSGVLDNRTTADQEVTAKTNEDGRATVRLDPGTEDINIDVVASTPVSPNPTATQTARSEAEFTVSVGTPGSAGSGFGSRVNPSGPLVLNDATIYASSGSCVPNPNGGGSIGDCFVNIEIKNNDGGDDLEIKTIRFNAYVGQSPGASSGGQLPNTMEVCDSEDTDSMMLTRQNAYEPFFDSPIPHGSSESYTVRFSTSDGSSYSILEGDYFVTSITYGPADEDTQTGSATYFVAPLSADSLNSGTDHCATSP